MTILHETRDGYRHPKVVTTEVQADVKTPIQLSWSTDIRSDEFHPAHNLASGVEESITVLSPDKVRYKQVQYIEGHAHIVSVVHEDKVVENSAIDFPVRATGLIGGIIDLVTGHQERYYWAPTPDAKIGDGNLARQTGVLKTHPKPPHTLELFQSRK